MPEKREPRSNLGHGEHSAMGLRAVTSQLDWESSSSKPLVQEQSKPYDLQAFGAQFWGENESFDGRPESVFIKGAPIDFAADLNVQEHSPSIPIGPGTDATVLGHPRSTPPLAYETLSRSYQILDVKNASSFFDSGYGSTLAEHQFSIAQSHHTEAQTGVSETGKRKRRIIRVRLPSLRASYIR